MVPEIYEDYLLVQLDAKFLLICNDFSVWLTRQR
jgi:hypothetical protein